MTTHEGSVNVGCASVDNGFVACGQHTLSHLLLDDRCDDFGLHGNGVLAVPVTVAHFQRIEPVGTAGRQNDGFAVQRFHQCAVFPVTVDDDNIILRI